jgi:hypothetical protein
MDVVKQDPRSMWTDEKVKLSDKRQVTGGRDVSLHKKRFYFISRSLPSKTELRVSNAIL